MPRAHPRSRGENCARIPRGRQLWGSSPLTRGKLYRGGQHIRRDGLIPAHAGKTTTGISRSNEDTAHPRSRGENIPRITRPGAGHGSSPLTRGKRTDADGGGCAERLIPAHAGKTSSTSPTSWPTWAHPRSRGENGGHGVSMRGTRGSSPLTRGKPSGRRQRRRTCRLIPAHAGKTSRRRS